MTAKIFLVRGPVTQDERWARNGHKGCIVWLTGLPDGEIDPFVVERELFSGPERRVLDGDNLDTVELQSWFSPAD